MGRTLLLVLILVAPVALGQDEPPTHLERWERFALWNNCQSVVMSVSLPVDSTQDVAEIGLGTEDIEIAVRSRLRSARIFSEEFENSIGQLRVGVNVVGAAFSVYIEFGKIVHDIASGQTLTATTWDSAVITGTHGQSSEFILSAVYRQIDRFIDDYLRVNEEACS